MINDAEAFLNNSDHFFCERYQTKLSRNVCIKRQKKSNKINILAPVGYDPGCKNCPQGRLVEMEKKLEGREA